MKKIFRRFSTNELCRIIRFRVPSFPSNYLRGNYTIPIPFCLAFLFLLFKTFSPRSFIDRVYFRNLNLLMYRPKSTKLHLLRRSQKSVTFSFAISRRNNFRKSAKETMGFVDMAVLLTVQLFCVVN